MFNAQSSRSNSSRSNSTNYTRNEWRRFKTTPETSGKDVKLLSERVGKMQNYTRNERKT